ncbi:MAG: trypsin-like peptidase domain-containing protein [Verrucomicrobia bacterium]|nr:trypsin-like peptidase domain-containing protein [Verrucomicrobiota bacterium]
MWVSGRQLLLAAVGFSLIGFVIGSWLVPPAAIGWHSAAGVRRSDATPRSATPRVDLQPAEQHTVDLFAQASPSVVYITTIAVQAGDGFFSPRIAEVPVGTGSGFVWDQEGHIITNYHVIRGATGARVTLADRSTFEADLVGVAPEKDLAVLRIKAPTEKLRPIPVGTSHDLRVGQSAYAIGNPFGLDQTLTTGVISALGREIESLARLPIRDCIQTDAAINPGNSGGPLLDSGGRLIGVNTQIYSPSGASAGIGFAIPVDEVNWVVPDLIKFGRVQRPSLGVELLDGARAGIAGALISRVHEGSGAAAAGLRPISRTRLGGIDLGDVIIGIEGQPIRSSGDVRLALERRQPGETVKVKILRNRREVEVDVRLGAPSR